DRIVKREVSRRRLLRYAGELAALINLVAQRRERPLVCLASARAVEPAELHPKRPSERQREAAGCRRFEVRVGAIDYRMPESAAILQRRNRVQLPRERAL